LTGFDKITIQFPTPSPELSSEVKEKVRRWLIGVEVVEESAMQMVIQCLPMHTSLPLKKALDRMAGIASNMQLDAFTAFFSRDPSLAAEVIRRDDDVDRFYHFIVRQLNLAISRPVFLRSIELDNVQDCLGYMLVAKSIERAADHASAICKLVVDSRNVKPIPQLKSLALKTNELFKESINALLMLDSSKAHRIIAESGKLARLLDEDTASLSYQTRMAAGSVKRIVEYTEDISEAVVNMACRHGIRDEKAIVGG
jgi:phosphate uptake regulator